MLIATPTPTNSEFPTAPIVQVPTTPARLLPSASAPPHPFPSGCLPPQAPSPLWQANRWRFSSCIALGVRLLPSSCRRLRSSCRRSRPRPPGRRRPPAGHLTEYHSTAAFPRTCHHSKWSTVWCPSLPHGPDMLWRRGPGGRDRWRVENRTVTAAAI